MLCCIQHWKKTLYRSLLNYSERVTVRLRSQKTFVSLLIKYYTAYFLKLLNALALQKMSRWRESKAPTKVRGLSWFNFLLLHEVLGRSSTVVVSVFLIKEIFFSLLFDTGGFPLLLIKQRKIPEGNKTGS